MHAATNPTKTRSSRRENPTTMNMALSAVERIDLQIARLEAAGAPADMIRKLRDDRIGLLNLSRSIRRQKRTRRPAPSLLNRFLRSLSWA